LCDHSLEQCISSTHTREIGLPNFVRSSINNLSGVIKRTFICLSMTACMTAFFTEYFYCEFKAHPGINEGSF
jgi:hypothetical protein